MATLRQQEAVRLLYNTDNYSRNQTKALEQAGYTKSTARQSTRILKSRGIQEATKPILERLEAERDRAVAYMKQKIKKAKYRDLTDGADKMIKNIQLLSGKPTEYTLTNELTAEKLQILVDYAKSRQDNKKDNATSPPDTINTE